MARLRLTHSGRSALARARRRITQEEYRIGAAMGRELDARMNPVRDFAKSAWRGAGWERGGKGVHRRAFASSVRYRRKRIAIRKGPGWVATVGHTRRGRAGMLSRLVNILNHNFRTGGGTMHPGKFIRQRVLAVARRRMAGYMDSLRQRMRRAA